MIRYISSKKNPIVKEIDKLLNIKNYRIKNKRYVLEGIRIVNEAVLNSAVKYIILRESDYERGKFERLDDELFDLFILSDDIFDGISDTVNSQGIMAVCNIKECVFDINSSAIILDRIQDPGNLGAIIRSADAFGIRQIVLIKGTVDYYNPKVLRATMGSNSRVNVFPDVDCSQLRDLLGDMRIYAADLRAQKSIQDIEFNSPFAIVIGNEGSGISLNLDKMVDERYFIKMIGETESLNAAVAASISMYVAMLNND